MNYGLDFKKWRINSSPLPFFRATLENQNLVVNRISFGSLRLLALCFNVFASKSRSPLPPSSLSFSSKQLLKVTIYLFRELLLALLEFWSSALLSLFQSLGSSEIIIPFLESILQITYRTTDVHELFKNNFLVALP